MAHIWILVTEDDGTIDVEAHPSLESARFDLKTMFEDECKENDIDPVRAMEDDGYADFHDTQWASSGDDAHVLSRYWSTRHIEMDPSWVHGMPIPEPPELKGPTT